MTSFRPLPEWLPPLETVATSPCYDPDLNFIQPGYHRALKLLLIPSVNIAPPGAPNEEQFAKALELLDCLLQDFPFDHDADRANYIGILLLALLRPAIAGNIPLICVTSSIPRSGKGALCAILEILATGTATSTVQYSTQEEEFRKALFAYLMKAPAVIRLDNVKDAGELASPHLASAITEGWYSDRILGVSDTRGVPVRTIFLVTGNNITVSRDLLCRALWIRLAPATDRPDRRRFTIDEIEQHVKGHRAEYLTALATMVEHWKATGAHPWEGIRWNSFNPFVRVIGGVLKSCGIAGFLANAEEMRSEASPVDDDWRKVVREWYSRTRDPQPAQWIVENVIDHCELTSIQLRGDDVGARSISLGKLLAAQVDVPRSLGNGRTAYVRRRLQQHVGTHLYWVEARDVSAGEGKR